MAYTTIDKPSDYMRIQTWSGNNSADREITWTESDNMQPDWIWVKRRSDTANHRLADAVRGATKILRSDTNGAETTESTDTLSFDTNGFSVGNNSGVNKTGDTYVGWGWKETATAGFDIVTYTGNQTARTISHNLGAVPKMMIVKTRSTTGNWGVYHVGLGTANKRLELDGTAASDTGTSVWNDTDPTSSVFSVGNNDRITNGNGMTYVAYLFAEKQGYSKFGSYTGNGNADGTFIYLGFKPAFVMTKRTDGADWWGMFDNKRLGYNGTYSPNPLFANASDAEVTDSKLMDHLSSGFKIRSSNGAINASGGNYIFMAFAENPFVTSIGIPTTAR
jgi:hypothetical protein